MKIIFLSLLFLSPLLASAQEQEKLAPGIKGLIYAEQKLLSRDVNEQRIMTPKANFQEDQYKPENSQIFEVKSYWVEKNKMKTFESNFISKNIKETFHKTENGKDLFLFLVHPESASLYTEFLATAKAGPKFWATSTSSSRTLLMWPDSKPELAFFGKLSLNKEIAGVVRTIPEGEVARSVGTNEVLFINKKNLPTSFDFFPETLSLIPKGFERGGMIVREIPAKIASGQDRFVPLFSLYADREGEQKPLLATMIETSGMDAKDFIREKIIEPFVKQWMEMVLVHGISMEPHAQNVLIGLNAKGMPNGKFLHRDFGGFNLDLENFKKLRTLAPTHLPKATTTSEDYHQKFTKDSINAGLETYFDQGFVYNLDKKLPQWVKKGWIAQYRNTERNLFSKMIYQTMEEEFSRRTSQQAHPSTGDLKNQNIQPWVEYSRAFLNHKKKTLCFGLFQ